MEVLSSMAEFLSGSAWIISVLLLVLAFLGLVRWAASRYITVPPSMVGVVYGRKHRIQVSDAEGNLVEQEVGFQIITGGGKVLIPVIEEYDQLSLLARQIDIAVDDVPTKHGVKVGSKASATVAIGNDQASIIAAIRNFQGMEDADINAMIGKIMEGQVRGIFGTMSIEDLNADREKLNAGVLAGAERELAKIGIKIQIFTIQQIWDKVGYLDALGVGQTADVLKSARERDAKAKKEAEVAESNAKKEAAVVRANNDALVAAAERDRDIKTAEFKAQVDREKALAAVAGSLVEAEQDKTLRIKQVEAASAETQARISLAQQEAARKEADLVATVIRPAEAEREAVQIRAQGTKKAAIIAAEQEKEAATLKADAIQTMAHAESQAVQLQGMGEAEAHKSRQLAEAVTTEAMQRANAAGTQAQREADAAGSKAQALADAAGQEAAFLAQAKGIGAKLEAEAKGKEALALALAKLDATGRLLQVLEAAPRLAEALGAAAAQALGPHGAASMFGEASKHLASIDSIKILDMGGNGETGLSRFAGVAPDFVFQFIARARALGIDLPAVLTKMGIDSSLLEDLFKDERTK